MRPGLSLGSHFIGLFNYKPIKLVILMTVCETQRSARQGFVWQATKQLTFFLTGRLAREEGQALSGA